ncbi:NAD-dependent epimerase/dehydratase family protein [Amycolatopsis sp. WGS_07]|uniref:NAD-dependent epimerase/dehydratase family protein n=1 Tax=Amycolatopsis sp. WGS_07 TaxID=3076764 RepID=UPI003872D30B
MTGPLVVVLGATGTIGSVVAASLAERPVRVRAVSRRSGDLRKPEELRKAVDGADAVVYLLADRRAPSLDSGVMTELLDAKPPVVIYAGTVTQVGVPPRSLLDGTEEDRPATAFEKDKHAAERALLQATAEGTVRGVSIRLPTVYGLSAANGRFDSGALTFVLRRAIAGEPVTMWHDGTVRRDLLHVRDAATAVLAALDHADELAGRHWLAGTCVGTPLGDAFRMIAEIVARRTGTAPVPVVTAPPPRPLSATDLASMVVDPSAFQERTGWAARVSVRTGLEDTVAAALA